KSQKNDSLMNIANDFIKQKKYQEAQTILSKVEFVLNKHSLAQTEKYNLLFAEVSLGLLQYEDALFYLQEVLKHNKNSAGIYAQIFDIHIIMKQFDKAEELLPYLSTNKEIFYAYLSFSKKEYQKAAEYIEKILINVKMNLILNNMAAAIYVELKQFEKAEAILLSSYKHHPADLATINHLAYLYAEQKTNLDNALAFAEEAVDQDENIAYLDTLAWVHMQREELDKAGTVFELIENKLKKDIYSKDQLSEIYEHLDIYYQKIGKSYQKP
ncbi:MAG: tetratricopeptide repeat protein, partial [Brevinema sp.]